MSDSNGFKMASEGWMQESHIISLSFKVEFEEEDDRSIATSNCLFRQKSEEEEEEDRAHPELTVLPISVDNDGPPVGREAKIPRAPPFPEQESD